MIDTKRIKKTMLSKGITTQHMCKELRIPYHALIMILDKDYPPTWEHLTGIARMIGCNAAELII